MSRAGNAYHYKATAVIDAGPTDWVLRAACAGALPDMFDTVGQTLTRENEIALRYCAVCPVRRECAADAKAHGDWGVIRGGEMLKR